MQTKNITNMKNEWADGCKARSHGSNQVLITHTARAGLFTGLPVRSVIKWAFGRRCQKVVAPGEGRHEGLVPRNDVLTNVFI